MLGAILGDFCGAQYEDLRSRYDGSRPLINGGCRFTDDSILTFATAETLLGCDRSAERFARGYMEWGRAYPKRGYGRSFRLWLENGELTVNNSFGNGSAMRVSPVGWAARTCDEALELARASALYTHGHPEGVKGAQIIAAAVFTLRQGASSDELRNYLEATFACDLSTPLAQIMERSCSFSAACQDSVPQAVRCFLESSSYEDAVAKALLLNGDTDTQADMAGALAQVRFGVPEAMRAAALAAMDEKMKSVLLAFEERFMDGVP